MTVLIAAVSFVGYGAIKLTGNRRGVLFSGLAGSLVSSTAVTMSMARLARKNPDNPRLFAAGALLANVAMMVRVIIIVFLFNAELLLWLVLPLALAAVMQASAAGLLMCRWQQRGAPQDGSNDLKSPRDDCAPLMCEGLEVLRRTVDQATDRCGPAASPACRPEVSAKIIWMM
jgi:uncharacterized membrane protein (DUF4010 family)